MTKKYISVLNLTAKMMCDKISRQSFEKIYKFKEVRDVTDIMYVKSTTNVKSLAGIIASTVRDENKAVVQTIGVGALNQAIKAITVARGLLAPSGVDASMTPSFVTATIDGEEKTAIRIIIE